MNVLCEMKKMFNVDTMNISERNTVVEISFNLSKLLCRIRKHSLRFLP